MTPEQSRIEIIKVSIRSKRKIDTASGDHWIKFHPYILYQDVHTKAVYCYGYYDDPEDGIEPRIFDLFLIDEVESLDEFFIPRPFWKSHNLFNELTTRKVESLEELQDDYDN